MDKLFCKQKPLLKNAYATFLQAKTFTEKCLRYFFASKNIYGKMKIEITKTEKIFKYIGKFNLGDNYGNKSKGKI